MHQAAHVAAQCGHFASAGSVVLAQGGLGSWADSAMCAVSAACAVSRSAETAVMHCIASAAATLRQLQTLGVRVALDDFGTGYASLSYLHRLPFDAHKIDRSFVHEMTGDAASTAIVEFIIALGHRLGLRIVAEGIEADQQLQALLHGHRDKLQGYLISPPVSSQEAVRFLQRKRLH